ncbi:MAG: FAD-dependent thymidylate synthase [Halothece sp.]
MDKFRIEVIKATPNPQQVMWLAMHQDYAEEFVWDQRDRAPDEAKAGENVIKYLLAGERGHYGPLEHPQITFNVGFFPHSMMQQIRTHRVGISFDVQSFRYTGQRILEVAEGKRDVEEVFYLRPVGDYTNRQGKRYSYTEKQRKADLEWCLEACKRYQQRINEGLAEEHARGIIPFDARQHFVMSCNARSLMHLLDLRWKKDAQLEAQKFCELLFQHFQEWTPQLANWYEETRAKKAKLSP